MTAVPQPKTTDRPRPGLWLTRVPVLRPSTQGLATLSERSQWLSQRYLGFVASAAAVCWHLPTSPVIYLFANVIRCKAVALLDFDLKPIAVPIDDL